MTSGFTKDAPLIALRGLGQIMFQRSAAVGALFLVGMVINAPNLAFMGVLGCVVGMCVAQVGGFPKEAQQDGLYGYNGALVGLALGYFYGTGVAIFGIAACGAGAATLVMRYMQRSLVPPLTFPFVAVTWGIMLLLWAGDVAPQTLAISGPTAPDLVMGAARSVGQVLFQENVLTGLIFALAITWNNRLHGVFVGLALVLSLACAWVLGYPSEITQLGLYGYSAVLCALFFAGTKRGDIVCAMAAILLSVICVRWFHMLGLPALTFPFVISTWIVCLLRRFII